MQLGSGTRLGSTFQGFSHFSPVSLAQYYCAHSGMVSKISSPLHKKDDKVVLGLTQVATSCSGGMG